MKIVGAALENDVHIAGLVRFMQMAEEAGHVAINLGPAVSVDHLLNEAKQLGADVIAVSYRLTPAVARTLFGQLKDSLEFHGLSNRVLVFGGTPPVAVEARASGLFQEVFSGEEDPQEIMAFLRGERKKQRRVIPPQTLEGRARARAPYPLIRHHFGLPSLEETIAGAETIAKEGVLDIISLGPDQNAQESFFRAEEMDKTRDGAGGVPLRRDQDLLKIYAATRTGNYPLLRCYSGTRDLIQWAEMLERTIHNAWGAIPIFWYSALDARSKRPLRQAIEENMAAIRWHGEHRMPVEINDVHQWSLRYAPDAVAVADAWLCAHIAKSLGVTTYVAQYMFNTPPETTAVMDLGKMLAQREMVERHRDTNFLPLHMVRAGLMLFSPDQSIAKGQLAASIAISLEINPEIVHVVGYSEADHAAYPEELIESAKIAQGVLRTLRDGRPDLSSDPRVKARKKKLIEEAEVLLTSVSNLGPLLEAATLEKIVNTGIFFAPHVQTHKPKKFPYQTTTENGCCCSAYDGKPITEAKRLRRMKIA